MRVVLKTLMAGPNGGGRPGDTVDLSESQARDMVAGGYAELAAPETAAAPAPETATAPAPEKAARTPSERAAASAERARKGR